MKINVYALRKCIEVQQAGWTRPAQIMLTLLLAVLASTGCHTHHH